MTSKVLVLLTAVIGCFAAWPPPKSAMDAYEFVEGRRTEARNFRTQGDTRGIEILKDALTYLDQPLLKDLARGNTYLDQRRAYLYYDIAEAYAAEGKTREAIDSLKRFAALFPASYAERWFEGNGYFVKLRTEPGYAEALAEARRFKGFWDSSALNTPFRENLPDEEKIAGLSKLWSEVKYNFVFPQKLVAIDWDSLYLHEIPRVLATKSTREYYLELMRLCALIEDGHTNVNPPRQLDISARPPLRTGLIEGHVMILSVASPSLESQGIRAGMEILEVDGTAAVEYARRDVQPYQSASTPQDRERRTFWFGFLQGPAAKPVRLKLRDAKGEEFEREVARQGYTDIKGTPPLEWRMLDDVAYVALNTFGTDELVKKWMEAFPKLAAARAMILDVRLNGGGDSPIGYEVIRTLVDRPVPGSRHVMRRYNPTERAGGTLMDWTELPASAEMILPRPGAFFRGPVVVLIGPGTFSAAENFLVAWKNSGRGKMIGEPSGGSTGRPLLFQLPGGGSARVCTRRDTFPDGTDWVGKGIEPDILVRPTVADIRAGRDPVLQRAIEFLNVGQVGNLGPIGNRPFQVRRPTAHTCHYFGRSTLVLRGFLDVIDNEHPYRPFSRHQFQPELFADGFEKRRSLWLGGMRVRIGRTGCTGTTNLIPFARRIFDGEIEFPAQPGFVDHPSIHLPGHSSVEVNRLGQ
jgi:C-terminal processing protease CtpA/Prc